MSSEAYWQRMYKLLFRYEHDNTPLITSEWTAKFYFTNSGIKISYQLPVLNLKGELTFFSKRLICFNFVCGTEL